MLDIAEDRKLKITYGAFIFIISSILAFAIWIKGVESTADTANERLDRQRDAIKETREKIDDINARTIRIETLLRQIKRKAFDD